MTASDQNPGPTQSVSPEETMHNGSEKPSDTGATLATLPVLQSSLTPEGVIAALDAAARKGKLPGLTCEMGGAGKRAFRVADFGKPFESQLIGVIEEVTGTPGVASRTTCRLRMKMVMPVIFVLMLVASVWPGILLTDSMLRMYFSWYTIPTWWWYLPLTVPFVPLAWRKAWRTSIASGRAEAEEILQGISKLV